MFKLASMQTDLIMMKTRFYRLHQLTKTDQLVTEACLDYILKGQSLSLVQIIIQQKQVLYPFTRIRVTRVGKAYRIIKRDFRNDRINVWIDKDHDTITRVDGIG